MSIGFRYGMSHCCESLRLESNYLGYTRDSVGYKGRAMDKQAIGDRIKMLRERKGWTRAMSPRRIAARHHRQHCGKHYYHSKLTR